MSIHNPSNSPINKAVADVLRQLEQIEKQDRVSASLNRANLAASLQKIYGLLLQGKNVPGQSAELKTLLRLIIEMASKLLLSSTRNQLFESMGTAQPDSHAAIDRNRFFKLGNYWIITFKGVPLHMQPDKGYEYIHKLLENPNKHLNSLKLKQLVYPPVEFNPNKTGFDITGKKPDKRRRLKSEGETKDELAELREGLSKAENNHDYATKERLDREMDELLKSDNVKSVSDELTRAQDSIRKAIQRSFKDIENEHPALYIHLKQTISMRSGFKYMPQEPINWQTTP